MAGLAPSTHKTYQSAERHYLDFCFSFSIIALPSHTVLFCGVSGTKRTSRGFNLHVPSRGHQLHISHGLRDPKIGLMPHLQQVIRGIKVENGRDGHPQ